MTVVYILNGHEVVPCKNIIEWGEWFERDGNRQVMRTNLIDGSVISTVFLGIDHGWGGTPQLFETALLTDDGVSVCNRYATWAEAEAGHMDWIERCVPPDMIEATVKGQSDA